MTKDDFFRRYLLDRPELVDSWPSKDRLRQIRRACDEAYDRHRLAFA